MRKTSKKCYSPLIGTYSADVHFWLSSTQRGDPQYAQMQSKRETVQNVDRGQHNIQDNAVSAGEAGVNVAFSVDGLFV